MSNTKSIIPASIHSIQFHSHEIHSWRDEHTGTIYGVLRPMIEAMGLEWSSQLQRLKRDVLYADALGVVIINTPGGEQEVTGIALNMLPMFLATIQRHRVREEIRATLLLFQKECAKVLADYWTEGAAINPRSDDLVGPWDMLAKMVESGRQQALEIAALKDEQTRQRDEQLQQQADIIKTQDIAMTALRSQQWVSLRQYVAMHGLHPQIPESLQAEYGRWLVGYCIEKMLPVYHIQPADRRWDKENTYPIQAIADTLSQWLLRRNGQPLLAILPVHKDGMVPA